MQDRFNFNAIVTAYYYIDTPEEYGEIEPQIYLRNVDILGGGDDIGICRYELEKAIGEQLPDITEKQKYHIMTFFEDNSISSDNEAYLTIRPDKIIQSTGLKDKNGKLIYEWDIVKLFGDVDGNFIENKHIVKFGDFAMYDYDFQDDFEKGSTAVYGWYLGGMKLPVPLSISLETSGLQIEIIGNIYENPELL